MLIFFKSIIILYTEKIILYLKWTFYLFFLNKMLNDCYIYVLKKQIKPKCGF